MAQLAAVRGLGGGGGGGFTLGPEQNVFTGADRAAAESARDVYFTANPSNLAQYDADISLNIRLEYTDSGDAVALFQVRNEAGDAWVDNSSSVGVAGAPGQDGADGTANVPGLTEGQFVMGAPTAGELAASSMSEESDRIKSTKQLEAPGGGGLILSNWDAMAQGQTVGFQNLSDGRMYHPVASELTTDGSQRAAYIELGPVATQFTVSGTAESIAAAASQYQFSNANQMQGTATQYVVTKDAGAGTASNCNIIIRLNSHTDDNPIIDYKRDHPTGLGFDLSPGENVLDLPVPAFFATGVITYTTIVSDDGDNLELQGESLDLGDGTQDFPTGRIVGRAGSVQTLALESELDDKEDDLGNPASNGQILSSTTSGTRSWIDAPTGGGGGPTTAENVSVDDSGFSELDIDNAQEGFSELDRLFGIVNNIPGGAPNRFNRPITTFTGTVDIDDDATFLQYDDEIALYAAATDQRLEFRLPTDATINGRYPVEFLILHQGGTERFTTGPISQGPNNTIRIVAQGGESLQLLPSQLANRTFIEAHQNDLVTITKADDDSPWQARVTTLSSGALILPDGIFNLNPTVTARFSPALSFFILGAPGGINVSAGDAFRVSLGDDDFAGFGVQTDDVIVALIDNPSQARTVDNDDWLIIRNAHNNAVSLSELAFLNQITESDTFQDARVEDRSDVTAVRVWLSPFILDHAPFITPSTDPDNPQAGETDPYVGGDEDVGAGNDFELGSNAPSSLVYVDIDGSFDVAAIESFYLVLKDRDGAEVTRHSLDTEFRAITLTGSGDTYYVFDDVGATDNFSSINYVNGQTIEIVEQETIRRFDFSERTNVLSAIPDGSVEIEKLEPTVQALIQSDHSLSDADTAKLAGLETTSSSEALSNTQSFYAKLADHSATNDLSHYHEIEQQNGLLPDYERTISYFLLIPRGITATQLQKVETPATKQALTSQGIISTTDGQVWQAFSVTLPAITGANSVLDNAWQIDGTRDTTSLTGAQDEFKVDRANLSDDLSTWIQSLVPDTPTPVALPENLQQLSRHLTITADTTSDWTEVSPNPIRADVLRQFAVLWDENRRTFGTDNYFEDLTGIETIGYGSNNIFWYRDASDPMNRNFPGAQSYILNSNIRIRNQGGETTISDSFRKIISFDYALSAPLADTVNQNMLRIGASASTAFMGISGNEGLFLNIGNQDGGQQSRTLQENLDVIDGHWSTVVGGSEIGEAEVIIPDSLTGSLVVTVEFELDNNGNDQGTHTETVTISDVGADGGLSVTSFNVNHTLPGGPISRTVNLVYDHDNTDLSNTRRVLFLRPPDPFTNGALTYNVAAHYDRTETWNVPATYAEEPVNAGNGHDDYGLFDPHLYTTEQVHERNRIIVSFMQWDENDQSTDPELACHIVVDGETESGFGTADDPFRIRLYRRASEFAFDDMSFGNFSSAVSHIQVYEYDGPPPSEQELQRLYAHQNNWLGLFWPAGHSVDDVNIDANLELTAGHRFIVRDTLTNARTFIEVTDGGIVTGEVT